MCIRDSNTAGAYKNNNYKNPYINNSVTRPSKNLFLNEYGNDNYGKSSNGEDVDIYITYPPRDDEQMQELKGQNCARLLAARQEKAVLYPYLQTSLQSQQTNSEFRHSEQPLNDYTRKQVDTATHGKPSSSIEGHGSFGLRGLTQASGAGGPSLQIETNNYIAHTDRAYTA